MYVYRIIDKNSKPLFIGNWRKAPRKIKDAVLKGELSPIDITFTEYARKFPHKPFTAYYIVDNNGNPLLGQMLDNWKCFNLFNPLDDYTTNDYQCINLTHIEISLQDYTEKFPNIPKKYRNLKCPYTV